MDGEDVSASVSLAGSFMECLGSCVEYIVNSKKKQPKVTSG